MMKEKAWWNGKRKKGRPGGLTLELMQQVANLLGEEETSFKELLAKGKERYGLTHTTLLKYLKHLVNIGFVSETHRGRRVFYRKLFPDFSSPEFVEYEFRRAAWEDRLPFPFSANTLFYKSDMVFGIRFYLLTLSIILLNILGEAQKAPKEKRRELIKTMADIYVLPFLRVLESLGEYDLTEELLKKAEEPIKKMAYEHLGYWYKEEKEKIDELWYKPLAYILTKKFLAAKYGKKILSASLGEIIDLTKRANFLDEFFEFGEKHPKELGKILEEEKEKTKKTEELIKSFIQREYPDEWKEIYERWKKNKKESAQRRKKWLENDLPREIERLAEESKGGSVAPHAEEEGRNP